MVYAVAYCPVSSKTRLKNMKFDDSKVLKVEHRDHLFEQIQTPKNSCWIGWGVHACSPQDISESSFRRKKYNLNELAHDTTINMIKRVLEDGVNLTEIYIDTVGPPEKYQQKLCGFFPGIHIVVAKKADSIYPIVSAASICAKVTRDQSVQGWKFVEGFADLEDAGVEEEGKRSDDDTEGLMSGETIFKEDAVKRISRAFGSGYPGDPNTVKWLKSNMDPIFGYPQIVRFSWSTCSKLLDDNAMKFTWPMDVEEAEEGLEAGQQTISFAPVVKKSARDDIYKRIAVEHVLSF